MKRYIRSADIVDEYNVLQYIPKKYHQYIEETDAVADFDNARNRTVRRYYVYFKDGNRVSAIGTSGIKSAVINYFERDATDRYRS